MLQPTDRVIAKTLARMYGSLGQTMDGQKFAELSVALLHVTTNNNEALEEAIMEVIRETNIELKAEKEGTAISANGPARHENWD
jgi:hypothetical protein